MKRGPKRAAIKGLLARFLEPNASTRPPTARAAAVAQATKRESVIKLQSEAPAAPAAQVAAAG